MASDKIYIIDESMGRPISPDYNLLLDTFINMEDYIEIKEKKLPGAKATFNNIENAVTKEVCVTGLLLHFSQDVADSRLSSILRRTDIEYLYLYADTIIINDKLSFPQANVPITCRLLIMEQQGTLSTTPEPHAIQYAPGKGGDKRNTGAPGESAGTLTLVCDTVDNRHLTDEFIFFMNGANGQNGEMGELKKPAKTGSPLAWKDIEDVVLNHDFVRGKTSDWKWANFDSDKKSKIYHARIQPYNFWFTTTYLDKKLGDENAVNQDNGWDVIPSGAGGNGGSAGNFYFFRFQETGRKVLYETKPGEGGKSEKKAPGKKAKDSTYYHIVLRAFHLDPEYAAYDLLDFEKKYQPFCDIVKEIKSVDGKDAPANANGKQGQYGKEDWVNFSKTHWVCPVLLETMLGFAKTNYRDGERQKAKWILDRYGKEIETLPAPLREDIQMAALIREVALYQRKLAQNLDFYGYPPGWIPKLSALSNLNILIDSRRGLARLIYFANDLLDSDDAKSQEKKEVEWASDELKKGIKSAQADINAAFEALPKIKHEIFVLEKEVEDQLTELRNLNSKILGEVEDQARAQAMFTGSFQILAGLCTLVPVGQPYLGQLGGGILNRVGNIDINAKNPLGEALSFTGGLSKQIGGFIDKNGEKLKAKANSDLSKEIDKGTKELSNFSKDAENAKLELEEAETAIQKTFVAQEVALLREQIRIVRNSGTGSANPFKMDDDYGDILASIAEMKETVKASRDIAADKKQALQAKLEKLATDKSELAAKLKTRKADKERREKNIEKAGKVIKGFTEGLSEISSGIQTMMVAFDENDPDVKDKMGEIKRSRYKKEFETIYNKIADINQVKLPLVEKLMRVEQSLSSAVQRINNNLVQWSVLSDQRVLSIQYGLAPATRASLKRMVQESWELLMLECYFLTKSYQYRFLKKIDPVGHGMEKFLKDARSLTEAEKQAKTGAGKPAKINEDEYEKIFNAVLTSQFKSLAADLLVSVQTGAGKLYIYESETVISTTDKNADGDGILQTLNTYGQVNFRLEDIESAKHTTDKWKHYRIQKVIFERIEVKAGNKNVSFDFGIRHSGDSYIRAADGKLYYFTSRSIPQDEPEEEPGKKEEKDQKDETEEKLDLQVQSWNAAYNGADRGKPNKGLSNAIESDEDERLLDKLLTDFKLKSEYDAAKSPYKSHYPGGSSELTLLIDDDSPESRNFTVEELEFKVIYERLN